MWTLRDEASALPAGRGLARSRARSASSDGHHATPAGGPNRDDQPSRHRIREQSATSFALRQAETGKGVAMKFVMKKTTSGEFRFNLVASNGQIVATSESYKERRSALATIESIRKNAGTAATDDQTQ